MRLPGRELPRPVSWQSRDLLGQEIGESLLEARRRLGGPAPPAVVSVSQKVSISVLKSNLIFCIIRIVGIVFRSGSISSYASSQHHFSQGPEDRKVYLTVRWEVSSGQADVVTTSRNKSGENFQLSNLRDFIFSRDYWSRGKYNNTTAYGFPDL